MLFLLGFYVYTETSSGFFGDKAKLIFSPPSMAIGKWSCLKFYYHMYGATINRLNVFNGNCTVFTKLRHQGNMWMYAEVTVFVQNNVSSLKTVYWCITELLRYQKKTLSIRREFSNDNQLSLIIVQITFEGIRGSSYTGDIAIDDVSLMEGICAGKNLD